MAIAIHRQRLDRRHSVSSRQRIVSVTRSDRTQTPSVIRSTPSDGFALNVGLEDWQFDRVRDCYNAAESAALPFRLFISFDMTCVDQTGHSLGISSILTSYTARCTPCASKDDIGCLLRYVQPFLNHKNQYYREGKLVISTFAGQDSKFGHDTFERGWVHVRRRLEEVTPVRGL